MCIEARVVKGAVAAANSVADSWISGNLMTAYSGVAPFPAARRRIRVLFRLELAN